MGFNPLSRLLQRLQDDADTDTVTDGGAVTATSDTTESDPDQSGPDEPTSPPTPETDAQAGQDTVVNVDLPTGERAQLHVNADVDPGAIGDVVEAQGGAFQGVEGQADDGTVIPVSTEGEDLDLSDTYFDDESFEFDFIRDDRIQDVRDKQIDYNQRVGRWIMHKGDLVPSIKERIKGLILGESGLSVEPEDPDDDADQRLQEHLEDIYSGDSDVAPHVEPEDVVDDMLDQNFMNARWVGRATDLRQLDLEDLELVVDGETGQRIYIQDAQGYTTFDVDEDDDNDAIDFNVQRSDPQALEVGTEVLDARLYDRPPLEAVVDDVVGKMELKFLKARKAQINSVGGLYIKVTPPQYLPEDEYFDRVPNPFTDDDSDTITKLEKEIQQGIDRAFDTLQDYKSGTVMAIPDNWEVDQIELPDSGQSLDDQIRGYNQAIARRLLYPLDLVELKSGPELSRETLFRTVINTLQGWREEIVTVFDDFAQVQSEIHDLQGDVTHSFPSFANEDEKLLVQALKYAGPAGMTESEIRQTLNSLEGFDLDTDRETGDMPPAGGPDNRTQQPPGQPADQSGPQQGPDQPPQPGGQTDQQGGQQATAQGQYTPPEGLDLYELDGWDQSSVWDAFLSLGGQHSTCSTRMTGELRNPDAWCAALKDQALGTDLWRQGSGAMPDAGLRRSEASAVYVEAATVQTTASLDDVADALQDATDADLTELQSEDDYVAFSPAAEPGADDFDPYVIVDSGDGEFDTSGVPDDVVTDMEDRLPVGSSDAQGAASDPLGHVPGIPDDPDTVTRDMLQQWVKHVAEQKAKNADGLTVSVGQQYDDKYGEAVEAGTFSRKFEPALHPRNPDTGQFVERPFNFDLDQRTLDNAPTTELLTFLDDEGEPVDDLIAGDDLSFDGIPDDADSLDEVKDMLDGRSGDDLSDMQERGYVSPDAPELRVSEANDVEDLYTADDGSLGAAADNMDVAYYDDHTAFVKRYRDSIDGPRSDGEKPTLAEREIAADQFLRNLGYDDQVPAQFHNEDDGYMASEKIDGESIRGGRPAGADQIDEDELRQFAAALLLAGNSDMHGDNWRVQDDGTVAAIDLNKSGGDFTTPGKFRTRGVDILTAQASALGIDMDKQDLQDEAEALAQDIDPDQALQGVPNSDLSGQSQHQFKDNIRANIEAFQNGGVSL